MRAENPFLDEKRGHRHLHDLVVGEGSVFQIRLRRVTMGRVHVVPGVPVLPVVPVRLSAGVFVSAHVASPGIRSSQCSKISISTRSFSLPSFSGHSMRPEKATR